MVSCPWPNHSSSNTSHRAWRLPFLLQMLPGLILGIGALFLPFSPRWLASRGRFKEALQNLSRLRQLPETDPRLQLEAIDIKTEVLLHQELNRERHPSLQDPSLSSRFKLELASWTDCFRPGCRSRTHIGIMIMFFQQ